MTDKTQKELEEIVYQIGWNEHALHDHWAGVWNRCDECDKIYIIRENNPHRCPYCRAREYYFNQRVESLGLSKKP